MNATDLLACSLNQRSDIPNQELADEIIRSECADWVKELVGNLNHKDKNIQSDSIKTLYEIGLRGKPELIAPYFSEFGALLKSKNNRLVWGAMIALDLISELVPEDVFKLLPNIMKAIDKGSVITIDHGVVILAKLSAVKSCEPTTFPLLVEQLNRCPIKQLPMYAERSLMTINAGNRHQFIALLTNRLSEVEKDSQKVRIEKVVKKALYMK